MSFQHVIIAGVTKCGTTSVFRYLADCPDVCVSSRKETRFFNNPEIIIDEQTYAEYLTFFRKCAENGKVLIEASPDYFSSGARTASLIQNMSPSAKIIVLIRDPVERLISYYKSAMVYDNYANELFAGLDFSRFVDLALHVETPTGANEEQVIECRRALRQGCYWRDIQEFGALFSPDQCRYFFFEDLVSDTGKLMQDVSTFIGVDSGFFQEYEFRIENKTRAYRSQQLQKIGFKVNTKLEPFFNRYPDVRRVGQRLYRWMNESMGSDQVDIDRNSRARLDEYYRSDINNLREFLTGKIGITKLPRWLRQEAT